MTGSRNARRGTTVIPRVSDRGGDPGDPAGLTGNAGYDWDRFNPDWYVRHNYVELRDDDRRILQLVRDFFATVLDADKPVSRGIDVGSGANLYPALAMQPYCQRIELRERGGQNVRWLERERPRYSEMWDQYWTPLTRLPAYRRLEKPREDFAAKVRVRCGNLFELGPRQWDLGTMFFVAESISEQEREFKNAVERFVGSLRPGAPFAAAFMQESSGYYVDGIRFPAVAVTKADVEHCLEPLARDVETYRVHSAKSLREGYKGMILAVGRARRLPG
jgi:hypothetical protein